jgi:hypothetical protein
MASQILIASNSADHLSSADRLSLNPSIEKIARLGRWFAFASAVFLPFLLLVAFALMRPDFNRQEIPDWRPVLALAEASLEKGELYDARGLYSRAARLASWREDWGGLLAAACGMKVLDNASGSYFNVETILVRAMMAGESRQSRAGIAEVARAFAAIGKDQAASMVLGRIQTDWPEETQDSMNVHTRGCW